MHVDGLHHRRPAAILRGPMISKTLSRCCAARAGERPKPPRRAAGRHAARHRRHSFKHGAAGAAFGRDHRHHAAGSGGDRRAQMPAKCSAKSNVPVLGVIENMSGGIFGSGGGARLAADAGVPLLGSVPLDAGIVAASDCGSAYQGACSDIYAAIAARLMAD